MTYTSRTPAYRAPTQAPSDAVMVQAFCNGKAITQVLTFDHIHAARSFLRAQPGAYQAQRPTPYREEEWVSGRSSVPVVWRVIA